MSTFVHTIGTIIQLIWAICTRLCMCSGLERIGRLSIVRLKRTSLRNLRSKKTLRRVCSRIKPALCLCDLHTINMFRTCSDRKGSKGLSYLRGTICLNDCFLIENYLKCAIQYTVDANEDAPTGTRGPASRAAARAACPAQRVIVISCPVYHVSCLN